MSNYGKAAESARKVPPTLYLSTSMLSVRECKSPGCVYVYYVTYIHRKSFIHPFLLCKCTMGVPSILFNLFKKINDPKIYCDKYVRFIQTSMCKRKPSNWVIVEMNFLRKKKVVKYQLVSRI